MIVLLLLLVLCCEMGGGAVCRGCVNSLMKRKASLEGERSPWGQVGEWRGFLTGGPGQRDMAGWEAC